MRMVLDRPALKQRAKSIVKGARVSAYLFTLLYLGIEDIILGPTLPAFLSPGVLNVLVEKYKIRPISTPEEDLKRAMQGE